LATRRPSERKAATNVGIVVESNSNLPHVVDARDPATGLPRLLHGGQ
jgi:hypothetical protein